MEIIIPAYNCMQTIGRALDSLVDQTNKNFTVLIVDDCSTQYIFSIIKGYRDKLNIRYIRNSHNVGCGMSRQRGIDETKSDYIAFLDSDDMLLPNAIEVWTCEIEKNSPDVIYSQWGSKTGNIVLRNSMHPLHMCHGKVYNVEFLRKHNIGESELVRCADDLYLNLQVFDLAKKVSILCECTYIYENNPDSVTHQADFSLRAMKERDMVYNLASSHIECFKSDPLQQYKELEKQIGYETSILNKNKRHSQMIRA